MAVAATPTIDIVIVTYNCISIIDDCLGSIFNDPDHTNWTVHVVDNASSDGTPQHIASEWPDVNLVTRPTNGGFGVANNHVLRSCTADLTLVLNPDAFLHRGTIAALIHHFDDPRVGIVGCRLEQSDGSFDHAAKRSFPTPRNSIQYFLPGRRKFSGYTAPDVPERGVGEVDAVNGAFMLVRTSAMHEVGYFDERFWMYAEDLDWCRRFHLGGWRTIYDGTVSTTHLKSAISGKQRSPKLNWHFHRSMALYYRTHEAGDNIALDAAVYGGIAAKGAITTIKDYIRRRRNGIK